MCVITGTMLLGGATAAATATSAQIATAGMMATVANFSIASTAIAAGVAGYGQYANQQAQNAANDYNAKIMQRNAQIANLQAEDAIRRGEEAELQHRRRVAHFKGMQRVAFAESGVVVDEGSPLDTVLDTTQLGEEDAMTIRRNAAREAWGFNMEAGNYAAQGRLSSMKNSSPALAAAPTLLGGAAQSAGQVFSYQMIGLNNSLRQPRT